MGVCGCSEPKGATSGGTVSFLNSLIIDGLFEGKTFPNRAYCGADLFRFRGDARLSGRKDFTSCSRLILLSVPSQPLVETIVLWLAMHQVFVEWVRWPVRFWIPHPLLRLFFAKSDLNKPKRYLCEQVASNGY